MKKEEVIKKIEDGLKQTVFSDLQDTILPFLGKIETYNEALSCYFPVDVVINKKDNNKEPFELISKFISEEVMSRVSYYSNDIYAELCEKVRCIYAKLNKYTIDIGKEDEYINIIMRYQISLEAESRV